MEWIGRESILFWINPESHSFLYSNFQHFILSSKKLFMVLIVYSLNSSLIGSMLIGFMYWIIYLWIVMLFHSYESIQWFRKNKTISIANMSKSQFVLWLYYRIPQIVFHSLWIVEILHLISRVYSLAGEKNLVERKSNKFKLITEKKEKASLKKNFAKKQFAGNCFLGM